MIADMIPSPARRGAANGRQTETARREVRRAGRFDAAQARPRSR
jgi:hypothetical protein